jgi:hypothetical protein
MQETHTQVAETLARTIDNLSRLPGAADLISPTVAALVKGILAQPAQPALAAIATCNISTKDDHKQSSQPATPPAKMPVAAPFPALQALLASAGGAAAHLPAQQPRPKSLFQPFATRMPCDSPAEDRINAEISISTDYTSGLPDHDIHMYTPCSKCVYTGAMQEQCHHDASALPASQEPFLQLQPLAARSHSTEDLMEAAGALASMTAPPMGLSGSSAFKKEFCPQPHPPSLDVLEALAAATAAAAAAGPKAAPQASPSKRSSAAAFAPLEEPQPPAAASAAANRTAAMRKADRKSPNYVHCVYYSGFLGWLLAHLACAAARLSLLHFVLHDGCLAEVLHHFTERCTCIHIMPSTAASSL